MGTIPPDPELRQYDGYAGARAELAGTVRQLQSLLNSAGVTISADGHFGPQTRSALMAFQAQSLLQVSGTADAATWAALRSNERRAVLTEALQTLDPGAEKTLAEDATAAAAYRGIIESQAARHRVDPALVVAIGSRESRWGLALRPRGPAGTGDFIPRNRITAFRQGPLPGDGGGFGRGLMQIDFDAHAFARAESWRDPELNVAYGLSVLSGSKRLLSARLAWRGGALLRAAVAAYNCGAGGVLRALAKGRDLDFYTHGRDYSADVLLRRAWFAKCGWPMGEELEA